MRIFVGTVAVLISIAPPAWGQRAPEVTTETPISAPTDESGPSPSGPAAPPMEPPSVAPPSAGPPAHARMGPRVLIESPGGQQEVSILEFGGYHPPGAPPFMQCTTPCTLDLDPRRYRLVAGRENGPHGHGDFDVEGIGERVRLSMPRDTTAPVLTMTAGGLVAITGLVFTFVGALSCVGSLGPCAPVDQESYVAGGITMFVVGAAATVMGVFLYRASTRSIERVEPLVEPVPPPVRVRHDVVAPPPPTPNPESDHRSGAELRGM